MKKAFLLFLSCAVLHVATALAEEQEWSLRNQILGVKAKFTVRVVDENGKPVEGAKVWARFSQSSRGKFTVDEKFTGQDGCVTVSGRCDFYTRFVITKDGYYETSHTIEYDKDGYELKGSKWQPYGGMVEYLLKRKHNPGPMIVFRYLEFPVPECDRDYGFDMEYGALVEPYGPGKVADFYIRYTMEGAPYVMSGNKEGGGRSLTLSFPNCLDGAYLITLDMDSKFQSPYQVDMNANYTKNFTWKVMWGEGIVGYKQETLEEGQGLILRTRTKVDAEGNLVSAHYGKIYGNWDVCGRLTEKRPCINKGGIIFFNPIENDTNLEFDNQWHAELRKQGGLVPEGGLFSW